jgi:8-oxo-dGTP pyrophosphatase MutT (NUDIX family)
MAAYEDEPKFRAWKRSLDDAGCDVRSVTPLHLVNRRNGELLFGLFRADAVDPEGHALPPIAVVRGNAVVVVPLVRNSATGEQRLLCIRQRRIGNGRLNLEFPAGMLDRDVDRPASVACRELREETGLAVPESDLHLLWDRPLYSSTGLLDEAVYFYGCRIDLPDGRYRALEGGRSEQAEEDERIVTTLKTVAEVEAEAEATMVVFAARLAQSLFS